MMEKRLASLEAQNRRLRRCGLVLLVLVGASILMGQAPPAPAPKVIEAQKFVVKDAQGNQRGEFGIRADGNTWFHMTRGKYEFGILVGETFASLGIKKPGTAFSLECTKEACEIQFRDDPRNAALRLGFAGGRPYVIACDSNGQRRANFELRETGEPRITMNDKDGILRLATGLHEDQAWMQFYDANEKPRLALRIEPGGAPSVRLYDEKKNELWAVGRSSKTDD